MTVNAQQICRSQRQQKKSPPLHQFSDSTSLSAVWFVKNIAIQLMLTSAERQPYALEQNISIIWHKRSMLANDSTAE